MVRNYACPKTMSLMSWENKILVFEDYDIIKDEYYYRPLDGKMNSVNMPIKQLNVKLWKKSE